MNRNVLTSLIMSGAIFLGATLPATTVAAGGLDDVVGALELVDQIFGNGKNKSSSGSSNSNISAMSLSNQKHARSNPTHQEKLFMLAVEKHDIGTAKEMLAAGVDVNGVYGTTNKGITPFYRALLNNDREMMQFLLENKADVNGYYDFDNQYICYLVEAADDYDDISLLEYLHNWGADINGKDKYGNNALNTALGKVQPFVNYSHGAYPKAKYLLSQGIDTENIFRGPWRHDHFHELDDRTAFLGVCAMGWIEMANLLAEHGANINAHDKNGKGALDLALETKNIQVYKAIQDIMARGQQPSIYREKLKAKNKK